eukprot:m.28229 g.28229  ORF g.28229 m.28229 type:complete len:56 (+) comp30622_c0_seq1:570-737(+)
MNVLFVCISNTLRALLLAQQIGPLQLELTFLLSADTFLLLFDDQHPFFTFRVCLS